MIPIRMTAIAALVMAAVALGAATPAGAGEVRAEQQKIRALSKLWVAAVAAKDVKTIAGLYTSDGMFLAPNAPRVDGREAIGKAWGGLLSLPGVSLTFEPTRIDISTSGDMAADIGTYKLGFDSKNGRVRDTGKYVVVWKKIDAEWKAFADIFNTDLAPK